MARSRYRSRTSEVGLARARQHIREARELSRELGGTDEDVKRYFFSLSSVELRPILDAYERQHSKAAREYAEATFPAWRIGSVKMSGQNAARLFNLLPRFMPLNRKYDLVESLWEKLGPRSEWSIAFGLNVDAKAVDHAVTQHVAKTINAHAIPESLQRRFAWLADGDSQVMQQLLNHFMMRDRQQAVEKVGAQVALILQFGGDGSAIQGFRRELKVGGHKVHVFLDPRATEVTLLPGPPKYRSAANYGWIWALVVIGLIIALILFSGAKTQPNSNSKNRRKPVAVRSVDWYRSNYRLGFFVRQATEPGRLGVVG